MLTTLLELALGMLVITTGFVVVRTVLFQLAHGSVNTVAGLPLEDGQVAEQLAHVRQHLPAEVTHPGRGEGEDGPVLRSTHARLRHTRDDTQR